MLRPVMPAVQLVVRRTIHRRLLDCVIGDRGATLLMMIQGY